MMWILIGETVAITVIGTLLHFAYDASGRKKWVGVFAAVNESTWEHVKLALSGIFACTLCDVWFLGSNPNYWLARSVSFIVPVVVIPMIFYGYTSFTRRAILAIDITTFAVAALLATVSFVWILKMPELDMVVRAIGMVLGVLIMTLYLLWTEFPVRNNLIFEDPITHRYGYRGAAAKKKKSRRKK